MRWDQLFADLEAEMAAEESAERQAEIAERTRAEVARLRLVDRLRAARAPVTVAVSGLGDVTCDIVDTGPDWVLLDGAARGQLVVALDAVCSVSGLASWSAAPGSEGAVAARLHLGAVLRGVARDRATVRVVLRDGVSYTGTVDRVGADFLELAEHDPDQQRRARAVRGVRLVPLAALAAVAMPGSASR